AVAAYPVGRLSDQLGRWSLLGIGVLVMVAADLALEFAQALSLVAVGVMLWGLHMALTQGILTALVADSVTPRLRGTAFGFFHCLSGGAALAASTGAGWLWTRAGSPAAFLTGAAIGLATLALIALGCGRGRPARPH